MRVVILRGRVSIGPFLLEGVFICSFEGCSEDSMYLFFLNIHVSYICMQSIISVSHKDVLMSFV